jgi:phosphatidylserine/phosphatidylglycerophosphate/cardiolipin synthase-like enzyme
MAAPPREQQASRPSYLARQRALLARLLQATREQRRHLVDGDIKGLAHSNRVLRDLLDRQTELQRQFRGRQDSGENGIEEMRQLARELQTESRANYLLACRGAQFTDFSLALLDRESEVAGRGRDAAGSACSPRLLDTQT